MLTLALSILVGISTILTDLLKGTIIKYGLYAQIAIVLQYAFSSTYYINNSLFYQQEVIALHRPNTVIAPVVEKSFLFRYTFLNMLIFRSFKVSLAFFSAILTQLAAFEYVLETDELFLIGSHVLQLLFYITIAYLAFYLLIPAID